MATEGAAYLHGGMAFSQTARLLELTVRVQARSAFAAPAGAAWDSLPSSASDLLVAKLPLGELFSELRDLCSMMMRSSGRKEDSSAQRAGGDPKGVS